MAQSVQVTSGLTVELVAISVSVSQLPICTNLLVTTRTHRNPPVKRDAHLLHLPFITLPLTRKPNKREVKYRTVWWKRYLLRYGSDCFLLYAGREPE